MGRHKKYRNDAEKMKAYRQRKKQETWSDDLIQRVEALRKNVLHLSGKHPIYHARVEVYRTIYGTLTYKLLSFVYEWVRFEEDVFTAIANELYLVSESPDTKIYKFN